MKILIVHNALNDSTSVSGVLKHYAFMANEWNARGHRTDFLVARAGFPQVRRLAPSARVISSDGWFDATRYLSRTWAYFPAYAWRMLTAHFVRLPERYDVIYASGQFIVEVYCARVLAWRQRCPWVVKIQHVLGSQSKRQGLINTLFIEAERLSARWINARADGVLCLSGVVAGDYRTLEEGIGLEPVKSVQVGCGIDYGAMCDGSDSEKEFEVVFLGRLHEQKGVFELPGVWKRVVGKHPGARLLVIGEGPHREAMAAGFEELGLRDTVTITGGIEEAEKNRLLARAKVGLSLSHEEGWGLSVTEFLATGLPVVAYELPVFEDIFPDLLEIVPRGDEAAAADGIAGLLEHPEECRKRGARGREFVKRYDFRSIAREELDRLAKFAGVSLEGPPESSGPPRQAE